VAYRTARKVSAFCITREFGLQSDALTLIGVDGELEVCNAQMSLAEPRKCNADKLGINRNNASEHRAPFGTTYGAGNGA
jgi:hypothetical protein